LVFIISPNWTWIGLTMLNSKCVFQKIQYQSSAKHSSNDYR
jgi:hypothetical protein